MARKTIASLEEQIRDLYRQLDEISKANTRLINEKAKLIEAEDNTFENSCLYAQMKKEMDYLKLRLKTKEGILDTVYKKNDKQSSLIQELITENDNLKKENEDLKASLSDVDVQKLILEYRNLIDKKDSNYNSLSDKFQKLINENDKLKKENEKLKANAPEDVGELQSKLDRATERNKNIIKDYSKCSKENEQLKKQLQELEAKHIGRPKKINDDIIKRIIELRESKKSIRAISNELGVSIGSVHKIIEQNNL